MSDSQAAMFCIVVKRGSFQSYDLLHRAFGQKVPVVWDRRRCERRQNDQSADVVSRRVDERRGREPTSWTALGFVVIEREEPRE